MVFDRWRQHAPHLCFLGTPEFKSQTASRSVQQFLHSSRQGIPIIYNGPPVPFKITHCHEESGPSSNTRYLGRSSEPTTQTASRLVQPFLHSSPQCVSALYNGPLLPRLKIAPFVGGFGPPSNTWFFGPTPVLSPNSISIGFFAEFTTVTDR